MVDQNIMRHEYRQLTEEEQASILRLKDLGLFFTTKCDDLGESRELSIAKTKMEEAVMWAIKAITK